MVHSNADGPGVLLAEAGSLDLLQGEATAGPLLQVVFVSRAGHHWPQLADRAGGQTSSLSDAVLTAADLPCWLVEPSLHIVLPVLVEVAVRDDIVPFGRHSISKEGKS